MDWQTLQSLLVPFFPPFFGVLAAFVLQWAAKQVYKRNDRIRFLGELKKELSECSRLLVGEGVLLPTDMWEAGKASGMVSLIKGENKATLASVYFKIQGHNYESVKVRDVGILATTTKGEKPKAELKTRYPSGEVVTVGHSEYTYPELLWQALSQRLGGGEETLKKEIDDLLKQHIWK